MSQSLLSSMSDLLRSPGTSPAAAARALLKESAWAGADEQGATRAVSLALGRFVLGEEDGAQSYAAAMAKASADSKEKKTKETKGKIRSMGLARDASVAGGTAALTLAAAYGIPKLRSMLRKKHEGELLKQQEKEAAAAAQAPQDAASPEAAPPAEAPPPAGPPAQPGAPAGPAPGPEQIPVPVPTVVHVHHRQPFIGPPPEPPDPPPAPSPMRVGPPITRQQQVPMPAMSNVYNHPSPGDTARVYSSPSIPSTYIPPKPREFDTGMGLRRPSRMPPRFGY